ncbi:hypothetical protein ACVIN2_004352 [Bradyrhizobium sp. USDA 3650]
MPGDFLERDRARAGGAADLDHDAQGRQPRGAQLPGLGARKLRQQRVEHVHVVAGLERRRGDDGAASDLMKREFQLAQPVSRIDRHQDETGLGGGELGQGPFRSVQRPDADPFAAFEAERDKAGGERIDPRGKLLPCPSHAVAGRDQRLAIAPAPRGVIEAAPDRVAEQRRVGDAANVTVGFVCQDRVLQSGAWTAGAISPAVARHES